MDRRSMLALAAGAAAALPAMAQTTGHEHHHAPAAATPRKFDALMAAHQQCVSAAQVCINHCQTLLAQGDKVMAECLRTALDTEAVCATVAKMAGWNSKFAGTYAQQSITVMQACLEACKPHLEHHAECKACHDACVKAIDASRKA